jgi:cysteine protease ATG4
MYTVRRGSVRGPNLMIIRALTNDYKGSNLAVYITGDGSEVVEEEVFRLAKARTGQFQPTLILIGTRLGLDRITPVYWEALKSTLHLPQSVGIAGYVSLNQTTSN